MESVTRTGPGRQFGAFHLPIELNDPMKSAFLKPTMLSPSPQVSGRAAY